MTNLVQKALSVPAAKSRLHTVSKQEMELAIAWGNYQVTTHQASVALGCKTTSNAIYRMSQILREAIRTRKLKESK